MVQFIHQPVAQGARRAPLNFSGLDQAINGYQKKQALHAKNQALAQVLEQAQSDPGQAAVKAYKVGDADLARALFSHQQQMKLAQQPQRVKQTALVQNLLAAGLKPGSPEFKNAILGGTKRQGTVVNNVLPGAKKGTNKLTEKLAEQAASVFDQANAAQGMAGKYSQINTLAQNPNVRTGTLGNLELSIKKIGNTVFGAEFDGLAEAEQISKIGDLLVGDIRELQGDTRMSDSDRKAYRAIPPNLTDSKAGIAMASEIMQKTAEGMSKRQQALSQLLEQNGGNFDTQVYAQYQDYVRKNPLLTASDLNKARSIASKTKQPLPGAGMGKLLNKYGIE